MHDDKRRYHGDTRRHAWCHAWRPSCRPSARLAINQNCNSLVRLASCLCMTTTTSCMRSMTKIAPLSQHLIKIHKCFHVTMHTKHSMVSTFCSSPVANMNKEPFIYLFHCSHISKSHHCHFSLLDTLVCTRSIFDLFHLNYYSSFQF